MKSYHKLMADAWGGMTTHITYFGNPARSVAMRLVTPELEKAARSRLTEAAAAVKAAAGSLGRSGLMPSASPTGRNLPPRLAPAERFMI
jgi:hypothetical protein